MQAFQHREPDRITVLAKKTIAFISIFAWLGAIASGLTILVRYEVTPGVKAAAPSRWPVDTQIALAPELPTLVMMIHPHCPCSRASVSELAMLMVSARDRVQVYAVFVRPQGSSADWEKSDLWDSVSIIPGVQMVVDEDGLEARRFGSETSGQVMMYGRDGRLLFNGGITAARGHAGNNEGRNAIISLLETESVKEIEVPVYGCPIFDKAEKDNSQDDCDGHRQN
jgi:hypothetical protein